MKNKSDFCVAGIGVRYAVRILICLACILILSSCSSEADKYIKQADELSSKYQKNWNFLTEVTGENESLKDDARQAIQLYTRAINSNPSKNTLMEARTDRGILNMRLGNCDQAIGDFTFVLTADPENEEILMARGFCNQKTKKYNDAYTDYTASIKAGYSETVIYEKRAEVSYKLKNYEKSINDLDKALKKYPDQVNLHILKGDSYIGLGNISLAINSYKDAYKYETAMGGCPKSMSSCYSPGLVDLMSKLASAYEKNGESNRALETYKKSVELNPGSDVAKKRLKEAKARLKNS